MTTNYLRYIGIGLLGLGLLTGGGSTVAPAIPTATAGTEPGQAATTAPAPGEAVTAYPAPDTTGVEETPYVSPVAPGVEETPYPSP